MELLSVLLITRQNKQLRLRLKKIVYVKFNETVSLIIIMKKFLPFLLSFLLLVTSASADELSDVFEQAGIPTYFFGGWQSRDDFMAGRLVI